MERNTVLHELNNFPILVCAVSLWKFSVVITCYLRNETKKVSGEKYFCIDAKQNANHESTTANGQTALAVWLRPVGLDVSNSFILTGTYKMQWEYKNQVLI